MFKNSCYFLIIMDKIYVPDTSSIIEGVVRKLLEEGKIKGKIAMPHAVIAELEHQANFGKKIGLVGLEEIQKIRALCEKQKVMFEFAGERPTEFQIKRAKSGEIDALIRRIAVDLNAVLITSDLVQSESAKAYGIEVLHIEKKVVEKIELEKFFDANTMSVHLKSNVVPKAKKGKPGNWTFEILRDSVMTAEEMKRIGTEIIEEARVNDQAFIEIKRLGSTIVQFKDYRIVITEPPLADGHEITAVQPIVKLSINDYNLKSALMERLDKKAEGVLIAGAPGMGKTTFAQALAEHYLAKNKIVKTIEAPRDMKLPDEITQYSKNFGTSDEIHDILLLSRPDYTIFDEMRNLPDFKLFSDLRLSGIGLVGVLHATAPIDAIQRFVGKLEFGMIPSVIDTVIFIKNGGVDKVYDLKMVVKVPSGMTEKDLARPVIEVKDFLTNELEYEMYVFGEETAVVPITKETIKQDWTQSDFEVSFSKKLVIFSTSPQNSEKSYEIRIGKAVYTGMTDKEGQIKLDKDSKKGRDVVRVLKKGVKIKVYVKR